jgi:hypothetical protein
MRGTVTEAVPALPVRGHAAQRGQVGGHDSKSLTSGEARTLLTAAVAANSHMARVGGPPSVSEGTGVGGLPRAAGVTVGKA